MQSSDISPLTEVCKKPSSTTSDETYADTYGTLQDHHDHPGPLVKNYAFKLKLFSVHRKRTKSEINDEKESTQRILYKCPYCDKSYTSVTRYEVHLRTHTGEKPFGCSYCSKKFNEKGNLKAHLRIHTGERPFACSFPGCNMKFKTKGQLNDHNHKHSNIRPYVCEVCGSCFNRKTRLKVHKMIHTGEKPYKCSYEGCNRTFREKGNLNAHMKLHIAKKEKISPKEVVPNEVCEPVKCEEEKNNEKMCTESSISCQDINEMLYGLYSLQNFEFNCYSSEINDLNL